MSVKSVLSELFSLLSYYGEAYYNNKNVISFVNDSDIVDLVEKYNLPEVTKAICHCDELIKRYAYKHYSYVKELYIKDNSEEFYRMFIEARSLSDLEEFIIPLIDEKQIDSFLETFNTAKARIDKYQKEIAKKQKCFIPAETIKSLQNEIKKNEDNISENEQLSKEDTEDQSLKNDIAAEKKELSVCKCKLTKAQNTNKKISEEIEEINQQLNDEEEYLYKYKQFFDKLQERKISYDEIISFSRNEAYYLKMPSSQFDLVIEKIYNCDKLPDEDILYLKSPQFVSLLNFRLENGQATIEEIDKVYSSGNIDIFSEPILSSLKRKIESVCEFFASNSLQNIKIENYNEWLNFILEYAIEDRALENGDIRFFCFWNSFSEYSQIQSLVAEIIELSGESEDKLLCELFLSTEGETRKIIRKIIEKNIFEKEMPISDYVQILFKCKREDNLNVDFAIRLLKTYEDEKNRVISKLCKEKDKYKNKCDRLEMQKSSEAYSCMYDLLENLEKTVIEIDPKKISDNPLSAKYNYIQTKKNELINTTVKLRQKIEDTYKVRAIVDTDKWANEKTVLFDVESHIFDGAKKPEKVKLITLGFVYTDDEGNEKRKKAIVSDISAINTESLFTQNNRNNNKNNQNNKNGSNQPNINSKQQNNHNNCCPKKNKKR